MDFVVVGFGLGGLAVLVGLVLRERAARRAADPGAAAPGASSLARGGALLVVAGALLLLVTAGALGLGLEDRMSTLAVVTVLTVELLAGLAWAVRTLPRRADRRRSAPATAPPPPATDDKHAHPSPGIDERPPATATSAPTADVAVAGASVPTDGDNFIGPPAPSDPDADAAPPAASAGGAEQEANLDPAAGDPSPSVTNDDADGEADGEAAPGPTSLGDAAPEAPPGVGHERVS